MTEKGSERKDINQVEPIKFGLQWMLSVHRIMGGMWGKETG